MTQVAGATALVTGGAGAIGGAIATSLTRAGATVVTADLPGTAADLAVDVRDADAVRRAVEQVVAEHGALDVVVAGAGVGDGGLVEELDDDAWRRAIDVNLWGTVNLFRGAYPHLIGRGRGHLVAIASLSGLVPTPLLVPYSASKAAVLGLAASLRPESARHGVGVSAICPGPVDTPMLDTPPAGSVRHAVDVRRYLTAAGGHPITPAVVGAATVRAITRNRAVVAPKRAGVLWRAARFAPGMAERSIASVMRKELEQSELPAHA